MNDSQRHKQADRQNPARQCVRNSTSKRIVMLNRAQPHWHLANKPLRVKIRSVISVTSKESSQQCESYLNCHLCNNWEELGPKAGWIIQMACGSVKTASRKF
jgi:hypothetical protein